MRLRSSTVTMWLLPVAIAGMAAAIWLSWAAPLDKKEFLAQKIMYVHVPVVWTAYLAFFVGLIASIGFLATRKRSWDRVAVASTEIGVVFVTLVLVTGPIWAKPVWKVWWQWDARLTSTLVMWFMYLGYLVVRVLAEERAQGARWSSVVSIVAFLNVPIVHYSVRWWRTLHPPPKALSPEGINAGFEGVERMGMINALWVAALAFTLLYLPLFFLRHSLERLEDKLEEKSA